MSLTLSLRSEDSQLTVSGPGLAEVTTSLDALPSRAQALAKPYTHGPALYTALGGDALTARLNKEADRLLYLDIPADDPADAFPWECAVMPPRVFLVHRYGLLRLVDREAVLDETPEPLRLVALGADALVDGQGNARDTLRLDILNEMRQIERVLAGSGKEVVGERFSPTPASLQAALADGRRTILHLSCHGSVIETDHGPRPVLHLEDEQGGPAHLMGDDLVSFAMLADLRLLLLSACRVGQAEDGYGRLTRTLAEQATPAAIGMQGLFPDDLSDDFAAALYGSLLNSQPLGRALTAARLALRNNEQAVGLPVAYVARNGDVALPLDSGRPGMQRLDLSRKCRLPGAVQAPDPFLGRNRELHDLAVLAEECKVITVIGAGGMGKTALAAAYARRFALRYADGVWGHSFVSDEVSAGGLRRALLAKLVGDELADRKPADQEEIILEELARRDLLLLIDNYESIHQARDDAGHPQHAEGRAVHDLLRRIARGGGRLLLTSRRQPAGFQGERVFPGVDDLLQGVDERAGAELFYQHCPRALERRDEPAIQRLARDVGRETAGHPLAIALLGAEYQQGDVPPERFLANWADELRNARSDALDDHHATFAAAFNRSYDAPDDEGQERLGALSLLPFPFFAEAAVMVWGARSEGAGSGETPAEIDEAQLAAARDGLRELVKRSLIEVDGKFDDGTPATWRFQPAIRQEAMARLDAETRAALQPALGRYAAWLSNRAFGDIHQAGNTALVGLAQVWLDSLVELAEALPGLDRLRHLRRVGWLLRMFGRTGHAYALLSDALAEVDAAGRDENDWRSIRSSLCYELAALEEVRGDLDKALSLYEESLALLEQIGDIQGKAASLSMMATVYVTRGDLDKALSLYEESLALLEQIGDIQGKAASLSMMATVYVTRGDLDKALSLYEESLALKEQIGDIQGKAASLSMMATVYVTRGDLDKALSLYEESLALKEQIGDIQGKAASLHAMANVYVTRGDLDKALSLYEESLALLEQIGDIQGKAASLSMMANLYMNRGDWDRVEELLLESIALRQQLGHVEGIAFGHGKLGQVAQQRGDFDLARQRYGEAIAIFQQLGQVREARQVEQMLRSLEQEKPPAGEQDLEAMLAQLPPEERAAAEAHLKIAAQIRQAEDAAETAAQRNLWPTAIQHQQEAVDHARALAGAGDERDAWVQLSVLLYNLGGYYQQAGRFAEAVPCFEEVVALDERTGHPDLAEDRKRLDGARQLAANPPSVEPSAAASTAQTARVP